jgi:hypothetical protein
MVTVVHTLSIRATYSSCEGSITSDCLSIHRDILVLSEGTGITGCPYSSCEGTVITCAHYHDCLLVLWSTLSNPSYYGARYTLPIPGNTRHDRLTLSALLVPDNFNNTVPPVAYRERFVGLNNRVLAGMLIYVERKNLMKCTSSRFDDIDATCSGGRDVASYGVDPVFKLGTFFSQSQTVCLYHVLDRVTPPSASNHHDLALLFAGTNHLHYPKSPDCFSATPKSQEPHCTSRITTTSKPSRKCTTAPSLVTRTWGSVPRTTTARTPRSRGTTRRTARSCTTRGTSGPGFPKPKRTGRLPAPREVPSRQTCCHPDKRISERNTVHARHAIRPALPRLTFFVSRPKRDIPYGFRHKALPGYAAGFPFFFDINLSAEEAQRWIDVMNYGLMVRVGLSPTPGFSVC